MELIDQLEKEGSLFVIRPSITPSIGRMENDPDKIQELYDLGCKDACALIHLLKDWLSK